MAEVRRSEVGETPTLEVLVYRDGELIERVPCESEEEAADVVASREEVVGVTCTVTDLSAPPGDEAAEVEPPDAVELYPSRTEVEER